MPPAAHTLTIAQQTITNDGLPHVIGSLSFTAVTPVNVLAGQQIVGSGFTLNTDSPPATYPVVGTDTITLQAQDQVGNTFLLNVTYTGTSGSSFTGCSVLNSPGGTSLFGAALPVMTGTLSIDRTGSGNHPWLNTLTASSLLQIDIQSSADGGTTWQGEASSVSPGGIFTAKGGGTLLASTLQVGPINPVANAVQLVCTATGPSAIQVSGQATVASR